MSKTADPVSDAGTPVLHWPEVRAWLQRHPDWLTEDRALLEELGLTARPPNVIEFGRPALARLEQAVEREAEDRKRIEAVARANFAAQTQTHAATLDLLEARNAADLARRLDALAQGRFGLAGATVALEKPGGIPFGWKPLEEGQVDSLLGPNGLSWLGPSFPNLAPLLGQGRETVRSVALIRMAPQFAGNDARHALCVFGSPDVEGFTADMGCELVAFIARVVERVAERWPVLS